jgi:hypothetical protein
VEKLRKKWIEIAKGCPNEQCHIKARALRAAAQGPLFKRGPRFNVSVYIFNILFQEKFALIH